MERDSRGTQGLSSAIALLHIISDVYALSLRKMNK